MIKDKDELKKITQNMLECIIMSDSEGQEDAHIEADNILCKVLEFEGYTVLVDLYKLVRKWYA